MTSTTPRQPTSRGRTSGQRIASQMLHTFYAPWILMLIWGGVAEAGQYHIGYWHSFWVALAINTITHQPGAENLS